MVTSTKEDKQEEYYFLADYKPANWSNKMDNLEADVSGTWHSDESRYRASPTGGCILPTS